MIACFQREGRRSGKLERGKIWMEICRNWRSRRNQNCVCMHKLNASLRKTATSHFFRRSIQRLTPPPSAFLILSRSIALFVPFFLPTFSPFFFLFPPFFSSSSIHSFSYRFFIHPLPSLYHFFFFFLTLPTSSTTFNNYIQRLVEEFCFNY